MCCDLHPWSAHLNRTAAARDGWELRAEGIIWCWWSFGWCFGWWLRDKFVWEVNLVSRYKPIHWFERVSPSTRLVFSHCWQWVTFFGSDSDEFPIRVNFRRNGARRKRCEERSPSRRSTIYNCEIERELWSVFQRVVRLAPCRSIKMGFTSCFFFICSRRLCLYRAPAPVICNYLWMP